MATLSCESDGFGRQIHWSSLVSNTVVPPRKIIGIRLLSMIGRTAKSSVLVGPIWTTMRLAPMSLFSAGTASAASLWVSARWISIVRPRIPPASLIARCATRAPSRIAAPTSAWTPVIAASTPTETGAGAVPPGDATSSAAASTPVESVNHFRLPVARTSMSPFPQHGSAPHRRAGLAARALGQPADVEIHHLLVAEQFGTRPGQAGRAEHHDVRPCRLRQGLPGILLDHHDRDAGAAHRPDVLPDGRDESGREPGARLIEQQQGGGGHQAGRHGGQVGRAT